MSKQHTLETLKQSNFIDSRVAEVLVAQLVKKVKPVQLVDLDLLALTVLQVLEEDKDPQVF